MKGVSYQLESHVTSHLLHFWLPVPARRCARADPACRYHFVAEAGKGARVQILPVSILYSMQCCETERHKVLG